MFFHTSCIEKRINQQSVIANNMRSIPLRFISIWTNDAIIFLSGNIKYAKLNALYCFFEKKSMFDLKNKYDYERFR